MRVTKTFSFDMAHALFGHDGPCKNIHGHTYHLSVTLLGEIIQEPLNPKDGMVIDFSDFKQIIQAEIISKFDHSLTLNKNTPHALIEGLNENFDKINYVPFQPSCENLLIEFQQTIVQKLPPNLSLHNIKLQETPTSYAAWFAEDN
ncbi:MAG: 6-carboxytetrahydropterin synthase [Chitinophagaceae bacterium]|nr:6-carboxytetrahydropterin synthase [Chitinophagaceae bacterium]